MKAISNDTAIWRILMNFYVISEFQTKIWISRSFRGVICGQTLGYNFRISLLIQVLVCHSIQWNSIIGCLACPWPVLYPTSSSSQVSVQGPLATWIMKYSSIYLNESLHFRELQPFHITFLCHIWIYNYYWCTGLQTGYKIYKTSEKWTPTFETTIMITLWTIWKCRNLLIFEGKQIDPTEALMSSKCLIDRHLRQSRQGRKYSQDKQERLSRK